MGTKENMRELIEALRSGEYKQGTGTLRALFEEFDEETGEITTKMSFCCEGVGCDLASLPLDVKWESVVYGTKSKFMQHIEYAPWRVSEFFGMDTYDNEQKWIVRTPTIGNDGETVDGWHTLILAELNDGGLHNFSEIAALLEQYYLNGGKESYEAWLIEFKDGTVLV